MSGKLSLPASRDVSPVTTVVSLILLLTLASQAMSCGGGVSAPLQSETAIHLEEHLDV